LQGEKKKKAGEEGECREDISVSFHTWLAAPLVFAISYDLFDEFGMRERKTEEGGRA
jgi:hypothetical protein